MQKQQPALILAQKQGQRVLATPEGFGVGGQHNYYFSNMLNCVYDCRYCFLQGMYPSANYVVFVNYEDFMCDIAELARQQIQPTYFFSGYDGDSLAYEPVTNFVENFLPFFAQQDNAILELRSKSTNIRSLLKQTASTQCIVAFSFTPQSISTQLEHGVPSVEKRIHAMRQLADHGWQLGLRFDPLILQSDFKSAYQTLIDSIFQALPGDVFHSVSIGPLRFPVKMFHKVTRLYPQEPLLAEALVKRDKIVSYTATMEAEIKQFVTDCLRQYIKTPLIFYCQST